ncbi:MAG: hypothetical protein HY619_01750 [Thaumarchaeota archaeon]|nr:hypothetical protein [Nitrososphaerota archaeon]
MSTSGSPSFMAGMNIAGNDVRDYPEKIVELLQPTPIRWIRVHAFPTRSLEESGPTGLNYLQTIEHLCKNGFNILAPIEVGYIENIGSVAIADLDKFIEASYQESYKACKKISEVVRRTGRELIFGIENEIDVKSWILQALPGIGWRASFEAWVQQAVDFNLKYKRLNNILKGANDADPEAKTMTNIVAEDVRVFIEDFRRELAKYSALLKQHSILAEEIPDDLIDWKVELKHLKENLKVDYVGLDNYANWIIKYPVYGQETGSKVREAEKLAGRPVFNPEFGYTTYRTLFERALFWILRRSSASEMQLQFYRNTLGSLEETSSIGTFPWVLFTHPDRPASPRQEAYFGLYKMSHGNLTKEPAFDYYVEWLKKIGK